MTQLPLPSTDMLAHSQRLINFIVQKLQATPEQAIPFATFMHYALYAPTLGYYSAGLRKFGAEGDFVTSPEISPLFARCLGQQCHQVFPHLDNPSILEFGAGSGKLAAGLLQELKDLDCLPETYYILEISADLQQRQRETIQQQVPELIDKVVWLTTLPEKPLQAIVIANEVLDAMPAHRFRIEDNDIAEYYVKYDGEKFNWLLRSTENETLREAVEKLRQQHDLPIGYTSEINLAVTPWIKSIAEFLEEGLVLLIDYGFPQREFYHEQRQEGTLMCHYRHHAHGDPLMLVGLQDVTTHVDFTAVAEAAHAANLHVAGYTSQLNFLISTGLMDLLAAYDPDDSSYFQRAQRAKTLILPSEMGELFKAIALTKNLDLSLMGFWQDERGRL